MIKRLALCATFIFFVSIPWMLEKAREYRWGLELIRAYRQTKQRKRHV